MPKAPVLAALDIHPGQCLADVGAGLGYFTLPMAEAVGHTGRVLAVDPSADACAVISERAKAQGLAHVEVVQQPAENTQLAGEIVDRMLWHTMYHDVENLSASIDEMLRVLKPKARWVIVDWLKHDTEVGPPLAIRVSREEAMATLRAKGLSTIEPFTPGPVTWGLIVEKP